MKMYLIPTFLSCDKQQKQKSIFAIIIAYEHRLYKTQSQYGVTQAYAEPL